MEAIVYETPEIFTPADVHMDILETVAGMQGSPIRTIVQNLLSDHSERLIRSGVHTLLSKGYLDGGKPTGDIALRLTSRGRILLQQAAARWNRPIKFCDFRELPGLIIEAARSDSRGRHGFFKTGRGKKGVFSSLFLDVSIHRKTGIFVRTPVGM
jgi:hypothetical protein